MVNKALDVRFVIGHDETFKRVESRPFSLGGGRHRQTSIYAVQPRVAGLA